MNCAQIIGPVTYGETKEPEFGGFQDVAEKLSKKYDWVYNPTDYQKPGKRWEEYMFECIDSIQTDKPDIYLIKGWEESLGCRLEVEFCKRLGLKMEVI
jgi:hypothetical protein